MLFPYNLDHLMASYEGTKFTATPSSCPCSLRMISVILPSLNNRRIRSSLAKEYRYVLAEEMIALDCPYCGVTLHHPLGWFKRPYFTCPACDRGLASAQFEKIIAELEQAMDKSIEEMVLGELKKTLQEHP